MKTATEILIKLEGDVAFLKKAVNELNNKLGLLLNRLNGAPLPSVSATPAIKQTEEFTQVQTITATPAIQLPEQDEEGNVEVKVEQIPKGVRRNSNRAPNAMNITNTAPRIQVQQKILYPDGDKVALATVNIFSTDGQLVKTTRTNSFGNWVAVLQPGSYKVTIKKPPLKDKVPVEAEYTVSIPMSEGPVELASPSI